MKKFEAEYIKSQNYALIAYFYFILLWVRIFFFYTFKVKSNWQKILTNYYF